jgi:hypothetical protein
MRRLASLAAVALLAAALAPGCGRPGQGASWNVVEEMEESEKAFAPPLPPGSLGSPFLNVKDEEMPCLKTCHDREKWATGKQYPHLRDSHRRNGKHCIECHAMGHRSAKADRRVCKDCH